MMNNTSDYSTEHPSTNDASSPPCKELSREPRIEPLANPSPPGLTINYHTLYYDSASQPLLIPPLPPSNISNPSFSPQTNVIPSVNIIRQAPKYYKPNMTLKRGRRIMIISTIFFTVIWAGAIIFIILRVLAF